MRSCDTAPVSGHKWHGLYCTPEPPSFSPPAALQTQAVRFSLQAGNLVRIAHGEDWLTTYGQLADAVAVKEGESVKQGQRIGTVAAPTKYGVALGEHLIFAMEQNGEPQNPMEKMKTAE